MKYIEIAVDSNDFRDIQLLRYIYINGYKSRTQHNWWLKYKVKFWEEYELMGDSVKKCTWTSFSKSALDFFLATIIKSSNTEVL